MALPLPNHPGAIIGYRKNGCPIRLQAGGDKNATRTPDDVMREMQEIIDGAEERSLTDEEVTNYETLEGELTQLRSDDQVRRRHAAYNQPAPGSPTAGDGAPTAAPGTEVSDPEAQVLERAFTEWVKTGQENADVVELRAQNEGAGPAGGYLVPTTMLQRITDRMKKFGGMERVCDVINTSTGETITWPTLDDVDNTGEVVNEGEAATSGSDLEFGKRELGAYRYSSTGAGGNPIRISLELLTDAQFDVEGRVMAKLGQRIARAFAPHLVNGTGVNQPEGVTHGATVANGRAVRVGSGTALTYNGLSGVEHGIDPAYREAGQCYWAFNDQSLKLIKQLTDSNGDPLWLPVTNDRLAAGLFRGVLLGYPVVIDQGFADFDADSDTVKWGAFGLFDEGMAVRNVSGLVVIRDPYSRKNEGEVEFVAHQRKDAIQDDKDAYVALVGDAS